MDKKRLVSGIKPTGDLTLGNYIGAIKNFVKLQDDYESYFFVADLHSLTMGDSKAEELRKKRKEIIAMYLACGINVDNCAIFYQSDVYEHVLAQWLLTCETTLGELNRMTQFKDKSQKLAKEANGTEKIPVGLLMYPTLMAADILIYNPDFVPIGEDQIQHLELTRTLASRINKKRKMNLKLPKGFLPEVGARIKSLNDPNIKMSKSEKSTWGTIYLKDDPELAYKKIMKAVTDSENKVYASDNKPGVTNLLNIYASLKNITLEEAEKLFSNSDYATFKKAVAQAVKDELIMIQSRYVNALQKVDSIAEEGAKKARLICGPIVLEMLKKFGLK
ncbi:tryptophan--tRNA ligase [Mycoplasma sp. U97]|uniref:tryptophan--tRNA ligase n=1 Tax=Mycoplasma tauri TaxID=547987 RepID=UPI001CBB1F3D|nr:tryptophan--tRNA ligase [Mycoplasma tauri]MBZ4212457.1 tryptophan--tRNA ligase [Mycoplasma tauri]